ncbi:hypothetical protein ACT7DL_13935 [Bacillus paranthracis]
MLTGLKTVEKNVLTSYSSTNFGPTFTSAQKIKKVDLQRRKSNLKDEAAKIAKSFLNLKGNEKVEVEKSGKRCERIFL